MKLFVLQGHAAQIGEGGSDDDFVPPAKKTRKRTRKKPVDFNCADYLIGKLRLLFVLKAKYKNLSQKTKIFITRVIIASFF